MDVQITQITSQLLKKRGFGRSLAVSPLAAVFHNNSSQFNFHKLQQV